MFKRITLQQEKARMAELPRWLAENMFFGFLVLFFIALVLSSFVFYRYVFSAQQADLGPEVTQMRFEEQSFQDILAIWKEQAAAFERAGKEPVRDIFANSSSPEPLAEP